MIRHLKAVLFLSSLYLLYPASAQKSASVHQWEFSFPFFRFFDKGFHKPFSVQSTVNSKSYARFWVGFTRFYRSRNVALSVNLTCLTIHTQTDSRNASHQLKRNFLHFGLKALRTIAQTQHIGVFASAGPAFRRYDDYDLWPLSCEPNVNYAAVGGSAGLKTYIKLSPGRQLTASIHYHCFQPITFRAWHQFPAYHSPHSLQLSVGIALHSP